MELKELDRMAKQSIELPTNLKGYEQAYYVAARGLYQQYAKKEITLDQARQEKERVTNLYHEGQVEFEYFMKLHQVWDKLKQLKAEGFDSVLEFEILETLDKIL